MDFDPYSEPTSMGVHTLNQYLGGNRRRIVRVNSGSLEHRRPSPDLGGRVYAASAASATTGPDMAFRNRHLDKDGRFVDFEVSSKVRLKAIWD